MCFFKNRRKNEKSKHATNLRGLCPVHDNAGAHKCKLVQDSWKRKLWNRSPIHLIQQTWVPVTFSCLLYWKTVSPDVDMNLKVLLTVPLVSVYRVCPKIYLSAFRAWILRLENEFLSRENTPTGWNEWNMDKSHNAPCWTSVSQLNKRPSCRWEGWGLMSCLWSGSPGFNCWISFPPLYSCMYLESLP